MNIQPDGASEAVGEWKVWMNNEHLRVLENGGNLRIIDSSSPCWGRHTEIKVFCVRAGEANPTIAAFEMAAFCFLNNTGLHRNLWGQASESNFEARGDERWWWIVNEKVFAWEKATRCRGSVSEGTASNTSQAQKEETSFEGADAKPVKKK